MDLLLKVVENNLDKVRENLFKNAVWNSDWDGDELGYEGVPVIGYYTVDDDLGLYINTETGEILEAFDETDEE